MHAGGPLLDSNRRGRRAAPLAITLAFALTALLAPGASAAASSRTVTKTRWIRAVCTALARWVDDTAEDDEEIFAALDEVSAGDTTAKKAKVTIVKAYVDATKSSDELIKKVKAAGTPDLDGGKAVAKDYVQTVGELKDVYAGGVTAYKKAKTKDDEDFYSEAQEIETDIGDGFEVIGQPLESLQANEELASVIDADLNCADVIEAYSSGGAPVVAIGDCVTEDTGIVSCDEPHFGEVFFVGSHPSGPDEAFPGNSPLEDYVVGVCAPAFATYVGKDIDSSSLSFSWYQPDAETWGAGDREIICSVTSADGSELTGTIKGSGL